jgi:hypothetical protein
LYRALPFFGGAGRGVNFHHLGTQKNEVKLIESIFVGKKINAKVIKEKENF